MKVQENIIISDDFFFIVLIIAFLLSAILKSSYWKHTKILLKATFAQRYANQFLREDNVFTERVNIISFLIMTLTFSVIIIKKLAVISLLQSLITIGLVFIFYMMKIFIIKVLGYLFMIKDFSKLAIFFSLIYDRSVGILLLPLILVLCFFSFEIYIELLYFIFCVIGFFILAKLYLLWKIARRMYAVSHFYIFLYLCTLEFFPILILGKSLFIG